MGRDTGSFVAVNPANVATLAARIHDLVTAIATESPKIKTLMQNWGDQSSCAQLAGVQSRFADQAIAMKKRADLAGELTKGTVAGLGVTSVVTSGDSLQAYSSQVPGGMIALPWDPDDSDYQSEAAQDAAALKKALDAGGGGANLDQINALAQILADHQDDPQFLAAFYGNGGAEQVYRIPSVLRDWDDHKYLGNDGNLTADGQAIVKPFADNLAAASKIVPGLPLPAAAFNAGKAGDISTDAPSWSVVQLLKLGPVDGTAWGSGYLAKLGSKEVAYNDQWVKIDQANGWKYDPSAVTPILNLIGSSPLASTALLTGPDGLATAKLLFADDQTMSVSRNDVPAIFRNVMLTSGQLQTAGFIPAATGPTTYDTVRAQAALNVFQAVGSNSGLTPDTAMALAMLSKTFMPDLAESSDGKFTTDMQAPSSTSIQLTGTTVSSLLAALATDKDASDFFTAGLLSQTGSSVSGSSGMSDEEVQAMGTLIAKFMIAHENGNIAQAQAKDDVNTNRQMWVNMFLGGFGNSSLPGFTGSATSQTITGIASGTGSTFLNKLWPTDGASKAADDAQVKLGTQWHKLDPGIVQGLLDNGTIKPEMVDPGASWYQNGKVVITNDQQMQQFNNWLWLLPGKEPTVAPVLNRYQIDVKTGMTSGGITWGTSKS